MGASTPAECHPRRGEALASEEFPLFLPTAGLEGMRKCPSLGVKLTASKKAVPPVSGRKTRYAVMLFMPQGTRSMVRVYSVQSWTPVFGTRPWVVVKASADPEGVSMSSPRMTRETP
jgi:hypothetical protein